MFDILGGMKNMIGRILCVLHIKKRKNLLETAKMPHKGDSFEKYYKKNKINLLETAKMPVSKKFK